MLNQLAAALNTVASAVETAKASPSSRLVGIIPAAFGLYQLKELAHEVRTVRDLVTAKVAEADGMLLERFDRSEP